jgi:hypothetical protein
MEKIYFRNIDDENCYQLEYHLQNAKDEGLSEIELFETKKEFVDGMFFCKAVEEQTEEGFCGKSCDEYSPKNGKSGMCRFKQKHFYTPTKKVTFKVK